MQTRSPSWIVAEALDLNPWAGPSDTIDRTCCLCGTSIPAGDPAIAYKVPSTFMDEFDMAVREPESVVCGACNLITPANPMRKLQGHVINEDGAFPILKDIHRMWFLETPPEPPFVAALSTSTSMHLFWRTPVTYDRDLIHFRMGQEVWQIDRPRARAAGRIIQSWRSEEGKSPFQRLDRNAAAPKHGFLREEVTGRERRFLESLNPGELWAASHYDRKKPIEPEQPDPLRL